MGEYTKYAVIEKNVNWDGYYYRIEYFEDLKKAKKWYKLSKEDFKSKNLQLVELKVIEELLK